jgi:UDP-glucose 4-epimerase
MFGFPERIPVGKTSAQTPANSCSASELLFEGTLCWYERLYGFTVVVLGCFNLAEATEKLGADHYCEIPLIPNAFRVALEKKERL